MNPVTDPELLKRLNGQSGTVSTGNAPTGAVSDPDLIARLNGQARTNQPQQSGGVEFDTWEMVKNIPGSGLNYLKDIGTAIMNPIDTAQSIGRLAQDTSNKLGRNMAEFVTGQEIEPMQEYSEDAANAVGQAMVDRYGSLDAVKNTAMNDPVGMAVDASGVGMSTKVPWLTKVATAAEPINAISKGTRAIAKATISPDQARKLYESAAKFSTTLGPEKRASLVQTALEQGIMPTSKGVAKVRDRIDILNNQLDDLISEATAAGKEIPINAVFKHLSELRKTKGGIKIEGASDLQAISRIAKEFHEHAKRQGKSTMTPAELQAFKVDAYKKINWDAKRMTGSPIKEDTYKTVARGAKDAISREIPESAEINKLLGELYDLQPHLQRSANRIDNRNLLSINAPINAGAGGVIGDVLGSGGAGVTAGMIGSILGNPKAKARLAIALNKIKTGDVGWLESNMRNAEVRVALALAGRTEQELSDLLATQ